jgi:hypothetical protein
VRHRIAALRSEEERGAILVITAIVIILLFVLAAIAVDLSVMSQRRQNLWNSADAAALAGASQLPDDPAQAEALALAYAAANDSELASGVSVSFRCVVGDRDGDGQPDAIDVPFACDPDPSNPNPPAAVPAGSFVCDNGVCASPCDPNLAGVRCNTLVLEADKQVPYNFAPVIGIDSGETEVRSAACRGSCGQELGGPVDLMIVLDRTGSMNTSGAIDDAVVAAKAVLGFFDPSLQHVGLTILPAGQGGDPCSVAGAPGTFLSVGLSSDYQDNPDEDVTVPADGINDIDSTSQLVQNIDCLSSNASGRTDLGSPIQDLAWGSPDAMTELLTNGRAGVRKGILFLSDGKANEPGSSYNPGLLPFGWNDRPCGYASDMAADAKAAGIEIITIGLGVAGKICDDDTTGLWQNVGVPQLLADMATGTNNFDCSSPTVNTDGDNFFCEPNSGELTKVFLAAAAQFASGSRLVYLPPGS